MTWKNSIENRLTFLFMLVMFGLFGITSSISIYFGEVSKSQNDSEYSDKLMHVSFALIRGFRNQVRVLTRDYAEWDETYHYVLTDDAEFTQQQLGAAALESGEVDGVAIHSPVYGLMYSESTLQYLDNKSLWALFDDFSSADVSVPLRGLVFDKSRAYIYTSMPVTGNGASKESVGRITFIKQITHALSEQISASIQEEFRIVNNLDTHTSSRFDIHDKWRYERLNMSFEHEHLVATYQMTHGEDQVLPLHIEVKMKRLDTSNDRYWPQLVPQFIIMAILGGMLLLILRRRVTNPIKQLIEWLNQIGNLNMSEDLKPFERADYGEIGVLSKRFEEIYNDLYEQHQFSQILLYSISDFIFTVDSAGRVDYCNPAAAEWLKIDARSVEHQEFELLLSCLDDDLPSVSNWLYRALHTYSEYSGEANIRIISQPDCVFKMQVQVSPMLQAEEGQKGAMIILRPLE
ncbi:CHASE4 domain-containing protein [Vibrio maerlii]|uniref:CHASE4 domain-containing protein n=1 Tax=Vibrio maerlii TaxID=2231648 RepID=UPI000E3ED936|nr:CHASE4 domain-containing protein [Vibrio maerlii]